MRLRVYQNIYVLLQTMIHKNARFNYLILIYLSGIILFTLFRIAETVAFTSQSDSSIDIWPLYWRSLWNGFRFDSAVSCYILTLPLLMMIIGEMARITKRWYYSIIHYLMMPLYTVAFFACAADIPFFCYFSQRLDATVMTMGSSLPMVVDMIISDTTYLMYLLAFVVVSIIWWILCKVIFRKVLITGLERETLPYCWSIPIAAVLLFALFTAMRGHLTAKRPLRPEYAVFCHSPFLNQIGLNPVFTFIKSAIDIRKDKRNPVELIDIETARIQLDKQQQWPLLEDEPVHLPEGTNVVLILMESMGADLTSLEADPSASLAPCLDSLMQRSITFTEAWAAGTQSYNGIYSTHYGHPTIFKRHSLRLNIIPKVCGLPQILQSNGYSTAYFMPHKGIFDGMEAFFYSNGYDHVFEEESYPKEELIGTYGVPDHILFRHALNYINQTASKGSFYTTIATCSNHNPYVWPEDIDFKPRSNVMADQMAEYADWSIRQFMDEASKQPWFDNTLFVFVADHGYVDKKNLYDIPIGRIRIPIFFYAPGRIQPRYISNQACQIDVAPTILGLLGINYDSHMLGIDILKYKRQYALLGTWEALGATDGELLYIYRKSDQRTSLHRYKNQETEDVSDMYPERKKVLEQYALGMVQLSYQMLQDGSTRCDIQSEL